MGFYALYFKPKLCKVKWGPCSLHTVPSSPIVDNIASWRTLIVSMCKVCIKVSPTCLVLERDVRFFNCRRKIVYRWHFLSRWHFYGKFLYGCKNNKTKNNISFLLIADKERYLRSVLSYFHHAVYTSNPVKNYETKWIFLIHRFLLDSGPLIPPSNQYWVVCSRLNNTGWGKDPVALTFCRNCRCKWCRHVFVNTFMLNN